MPTPEELLDQLHADLARADHDEDASGMDRRQFMFMSLVSAAATTFGASAVQAQRTLAAAGTGAFSADGVRSLLQQQQVPPVALGNGEAPALQFMPYAGGTGALMESSRASAAAPRSIAPCSPSRRSLARCRPIPMISRFCRRTDCPR